MTITQTFLKLKKKILHHNHDKYITTQEFNNITAERFNARLAQAKWVTRANIADFAKKSYFWWKTKKKMKKLLQIKQMIALVQQKIILY